MNESERLIASVERTLQWLLNNSPQATTLIAQAEQILDEIRATMRGQGRA